MLEKIAIRFALVLAIISLCASATVAQTTSFTYQGRLTDGGTPANNNYDLQFTLWDAASGGTRQPQPAPVTVTRNNVSVSGGIFTVQLDFTVNAFPGADRFLEIAVRPVGVGAFTTLSPRQQISSTPYAIRTLSAATADTATNATQLGGIAAANYVQTNDARLSDSRPPTAGSANYIQNNSASTQSGSFNISGNGTAGGTLTANVVNTTTQFNLGGNRVLSTAGNSNLFVGAGSGQANTSGASNAFVGASAGLANTIGARNAFFGFNAGRNNVGDAFGNGSDNSFFGSSAGSSNTGQQNAFFGRGAGAGNTSGSFNSFFGEAAGLNNTTGGFNTFIGSNTGFSSAGPSNTSGSNDTALGLGAMIGLDAGNNNVTNATAIGANGFVTRSNSLVLGSINGVNGAAADTLVGIGTTEPGSKLEVHGIKAGLTCNVVTIVYGNARTLPGCGDALGVTTDDPTKNLIDGANNSGTVFQVGGDGEIRTLGALSVGTFSPVRTLTVNGRARIGSIPPEASAASVCFNAAGDLLQCGASSLRFKTDVHPFLSGLDIIRRLHPISFNWKDGSGHDIGLGAEDVAKVAPSFTFTDSKGEITGVKYDRLNILLINAVKEQQKQIATLVTSNAALNARLRGVEKSLRKKAGSARRRR